MNVQINLSISKTNHERYEYKNNSFLLYSDLSISNLSKPTNTKQHTYKYDVNGNFTEVDGRTVCEYIYDQSGNWIKKTDVIGSKGILNRKIEYYN